MSITELPTLRLYWSTSEFGQNFVRNLVARNRFCKILLFLHYYDRTELTITQTETRKNGDVFFHKITSRRHF